MSFFAKRHEAPAYCRPCGLAPGYPGYLGDGLVPMAWPAECVPMQDVAGSLLPVPVPGPPGGCCDNPHKFAPCAAADVHAEACEANPMALYGEPAYQDLVGRMNRIDVEEQRKLLQEERQRLEAIEKDNKMKSWGHLEEMLQSQTVDPEEHDHSLVLMIMTPAAEEHCLQTFQHMTLRKPMPHEAEDNRLFRVIKTKDSEHEQRKKYEIADVLYYDFGDEDVAQAEENFYESVKLHELDWPRKLQKHGAEWVLIRSKYEKSFMYMKKLYETKCIQVEFDKAYYTLCRLYEEPMRWTRAQKSETALEYKAPEHTFGQEPVFESYEEQKKLLHELFCTEKKPYGYDMVDIRDFLIKKPEWRADYHDLMCANVHYGQFKLLERSMFLILFAAYKYKREQQQLGEDLSMDEVLKRLTCVYIGGGCASPDNENQHFHLLMKLIPHFLMVSYDVYKPDIGGTVNKKRKVEAEDESLEQETSKHIKADIRNRLLNIQKMCDYAEVQKIRNTMKQTNGERFYVVIQDIRSDISLVLCELEGYRKVVKRLVYALNKGRERQHPLPEKSKQELRQKIKTALEHKQQLREKMQELIANDNICQMIFASTLCEAPNCMAVSAKWTFEYPASRKNMDITQCPHGFVFKQSFLGSSTEYVAVFTSSMDMRTRMFSEGDTRGLAKWGDKQGGQKWKDQQVGIEPDGRFITNQYEFLIPADLKEDYKNLCGTVRKSTVDGLVAYLQLKDPREEHIGGGTKYLVLHMYAQLCGDLQEKTDYRTPSFLWYQLQHAQQKALHKKACAVEHGWYLREHMTSSKKIKITPEEFENKNTLSDKDVDKFVASTHLYMRTKKEYDQVVNNISAQYCLAKYVEHMQDASTIWDFSEEGYIVAIALSLEPKERIQDILQQCPDKKALGQLLMRLCDQYHILTRAGVERLPVVKRALLHEVQELSDWPGLDIAIGDPELREYAPAMSMLTRDFYCNVVLPYVMTKELRPRLRNANVHKLFAGFRAYLKITPQGHLCWPMENGNTRKFHDYPSNKSYLELAIQYDILPLLQLCFMKAQSDGPLVEMQPDEYVPILQKKFNKKQGDYTYPLNLAVYYGCAELVEFLADKCEKAGRTDIIWWKSKYGREEEPAIGLARKYLIKNPKKNAQHMVTKYDTILQFLSKYDTKEAKTSVQNRAFSTLGTKPLMSQQDQQASNVLTPTQPRSENVARMDVDESAAGSVPVPVPVKTYEQPTARAGTAVRKLGSASVPAIEQEQQTRKDLEKAPSADERPYSSKPAPKSLDAVSNIEKVKK